MLSRLSDVPGVDMALDYVAEVYRSRGRRPARTDQHPIDVALLLAREDQPPRVVVAGLLHDVLEDTDVTVEELRRHFGAEVTRLVEAVTQDDCVESYADRKAQLRRRTLEGGVEAATIALADKAAKLAAAKERPKPRKLAHYRATLDEIEDRYGPSPLSVQLRQELARWPPE